MSNKQKRKNHRSCHKEKFTSGLCMAIVVSALFVSYGIVSYADTNVYLTKAQNVDTVNVKLDKSEVADMISDSAETVILTAQATVEKAEVTEEKMALDETEAEVVAYTMWATASLNVRAGAGTEYDIIGYYAYADEVYVISSDDGWSKVMYRDGNIAYVATSFLSETELTPKKSYNGIYEGDNFSAILTYYCSCSICCGSGNGITASGCQVHDGVVACNWLPLGTIVSIDDVQYTVADRGSSTFNTVGRFDVYTSLGHQAALNFGKTYTNVTIVSLP